MQFNLSTEYSMFYYGEGFHLECVQHPYSSTNLNYSGFGNLTQRRYP